MEITIEKQVNIEEFVLENFEEYSNLNTFSNRNKLKRELVYSKAGNKLTLFFPGLIRDNDGVEFGYLNSKNEIHNFKVILSKRFIFDKVYQSICLVFVIIMLSIGPMSEILEGESYWTIFILGLVLGFPILFEIYSYRNRFDRFRKAFY